MEITTTGIYGVALEAIQQKLAKENRFYWNGDLTASTKVLVVGNRNSRKYAVARRQRLPCVTPGWVLEGNCDMASLAKYEVTNSIQGKEICSTSLEAQDKVTLEQICGQKLALYNSTLTKKCSILVIPDSMSTDPSLSANAGNPKIQFAARNHIPLVNFKHFVTDYQPVPVDGPPETIDPDSTSFPVRSSAVPPRLTAPRRDSRETLTTPLSMSQGRSQECYNDMGNTFSDLSACMDDVVACLSPPWKLHSYVGLTQLLTLSGISVSVELTDKTTHVILLGEECEEVFFPRPGLDFVSVKWLEKCVRERRRVSCVPFRIPVEFSPVIVFSSISTEQKRKLEQELVEKKLHCTIQSSLLLGNGCSAKHNATHITTHLVVPQEGYLRSRKVITLAEFAAQLKDIPVCHLVDVQWVVKSIQAGRWLDWEFFRIEMPSQKDIKSYWESNPIVIPSTLSTQARGQGEDGPPSDDADADAAFTPTKECVPEEGASLSQHEPAEAPQELRERRETTERVSPVPMESVRQEETLPVVDESLPSLTLEALLMDLEGGILKGKRSVSPVARSGPTEGSSHGTSSGQNDGHSHNGTVTDPTVERVPPSNVTSPRVSTAFRLIGNTISARPSAVKRSTRPETMESQEVIYAKTAFPTLFPMGVGLTPPVVQPSAPPPVHHTEEEAVSEEEEMEDENDNGLSSCVEPVLLINKDVYSEMNVEALLQSIPASYRVTNEVKECTHFVVGKLAKTELFLCCLAAGKWIVAPSYLSASGARQTFVKETMHEWNVQRVKRCGLRSSAIALGKACSKQRKATERPFAHWSVILTCSNVSRAQGFERVLECGGCTSVVQSSSREVLENAQQGLYSKDPSTDGGQPLRSLFILSDDNVWSETQVEWLTELCGRTVLRLEYMVHYMSVEDPNPSEYELLQSIRSKKRSRTSSR